MKKRFFKKIYRYPLYLGAVGLKLIIQYLPRDFALKLGKVSGVLCFQLLHKEKKRTLKQLEMVFGKEKAETIAKKVFINLGMNFMEWLQMPKLKTKNLDSVFKATGLEKIDKVLSLGKGGIILTAHFGNWEYLGAYLMQKGYKGTVIVKKIYYKPYNDLLNKLRNSVGVFTVNRNGSVRNMIRILKNNNLLAILPDQDTDKVEGIFIDFFGFPAYTPTGPVSLARATGTSIIPCFIVRENEYHHVYVEDPFDLVDTGNKTEDIKINTERWSKILEDYIRRYPEQWVWMHKRWRVQEKYARN